MIKTFKDIKKTLKTLKNKSREKTLKRDKNEKRRGRFFTSKAYSSGLVHQSLVGLAPAYLADDCRLLSDVGRRPLRSNSK